jgi:hypothetical protein
MEVLPDPFPQALVSFKKCMPLPLPYLWKRRGHIFFE